MNEKMPDNPRSRDDHQLQDLVGETRKWMQERGIAETEPDWDAIARGERARWWRDRMKAAVAELAARLQSLPATLAATVRLLAEAVEMRAEGAVEVTLDTAQRIGRVLFEPASGCVPAGTVRFNRPKSLVLGPKDRRTNESVGILVSAALPQARVSADARDQTITVEVPNTSAALLLILIPEDTETAPLLAQATVEGNVLRAQFENVAPGNYLLSIHTVVPGLGDGGPSS